MLNYDEFPPRTHDFPKILSCDLGLMIMDACEEIKSILIYFIELCHYSCLNCSTIGVMMNFDSCP